MSGACICCWKNWRRHLVEGTQERDEEIERLENDTCSSDDLKAAEEELKQRNIEVEAWKPRRDD